MKGKVKKFSTKVIVMVIISIIVLFMFGMPEKQQIMDNLDYDVTLNENGSATVTETWDMYINKTNTIFKTFKISPSKYGEITDVTVKDLEKHKDLNRINQEMYHVAEDCYYALITQKGEFEVAWGVGMDKKSGKRKFQLQYTINDVITDYKDLQEFYWQFLGKGQNAVPVKKVTGRIRLPKDVENIENLKVWGHGPLNGEINPISKNEVEFKIKNLQPGQMLEVRVVTTDKMFNTNDKKIREYNYLKTLLNEERKWADQANSERQRKMFLVGIFFVIYLIIILVYIFKIRKYQKKRKERKEKVAKIEYYRDIPRKGNSTPAEANYLYKFNKERLSTKDIQNTSVSATILDLCLKKVISLRVQEDKVYIKILKKPENLKEDELEIYKLLKEVGKKKEEFEIEELNKFANKEYYKYSEYINKLVNHTRNNLYKMKLIDKANERNYRKYTYAESKEIIVRNLSEWILVTLMVTLLPLFHNIALMSFGIGYFEFWVKWIVILAPIILAKLYIWKMQIKIKDNISVLTKEGAKEQEEWKGLKRYMENFSLLEEREVPELAIWEEYLVYATAFGIADKVIEQMKAAYPKVFIKEKWEEGNKENEELLNYPLINFSMSYNSRINPIGRINSISNKAYSSSMHQIAVHSSSSSGGGSGGGFSGGGGGRRWRRPVWEDAKVKEGVRDIP